MKKSIKCFHMFASKQHVKVELNSFFVKTYYRSRFFILIFRIQIFLSCLCICLVCVNFNFYYYLNIYIFTSLLQSIFQCKLNGFSVKTETKNLVLHIIMTSLYYVIVLNFKSCL